MASTRDWFETVAEAQRRARRQLPKGVYLALVAGAEAGVTMNDNVSRVLASSGSGRTWRTCRRRVSWLPP